MADCTPPDDPSSPDDGGYTSDKGHYTQAAWDAAEPTSGGSYCCSACGSCIEHFDDHGFVFTFCPSCDRKLRDDLTQERELQLREERIVRKRGW